MGNKDRNNANQVDITLTDSYHHLLYNSIVATQPQRGAAISPEVFMLREPRPYIPPKEQKRGE